MDTVLVGVLFVAMFTLWWVRKPDWSRHDSGRAPRLRTPIAPAAAPPAVDGLVLSGTFLPDIEGLRAVAVLLVLVYHAKFDLFSGGLIGVDVFFVLSGFLITSLLLREMASTGTVSLANFWARRARRLLPASGLVIVFTLLAGRVVLDGLTQADLGHDAIAACLFVANIRFWHVGTDYLAGGLPESGLLHFWSLAVEEQFYMIWPWLLLGMVKVARLKRWALGTVMALIAAGSLAWCVWATYGDARWHSWAFFMLPARAWELMAGALLALAGGHLWRLLGRVADTVSASLGWLGLGAIVGMSVAYRSTPLFPGYITAIPVVATVLLIHAGTATPDAGPAVLLRTRPMQWIGARSYAIYLWHFPLLVLAGQQWGEGRLIEGLPVGTRLAVLAASIVAAALSYQLVENPVRFAKSLTANPARSLAMGAWIALIGLGGAALLINNPPPESAGAAAAEVTLATLPADGTTATSTTIASVVTEVIDSAVDTTSTSSTTTTEAPHAADASHDNPAALASLIAANRPALENGVTTAKVPSNLSPSLGNSRNDLPQIYDNGCILDVGNNQPQNCIYGDAGGSVTIVLFGDSHAAQWMPAMHKVAVNNGWRLIIHTKKACPTAEIPTDKDPNGTDCMVWRQRVIDQIGSMHPDLVVMSAYRYKQVGAAAGRDPDTVWKEGIDLTVSKVRPLTDHLLLLGDSATPLEDVPSCLSGNLSNVPRCMNSRDGAVRPGRLAVEREVAIKYDADFIPTSDWMCTDSACPVIVGNTLMYRDNSHITATASLFLAPYVDAALKSVLA